jgi:prolyl-tRNA synthetase
MKEKQQSLALNVKKDENISEWYTELIQKAQLAEYSKVSGCIVYMPRSYEVWEKIRDFFDEKIKKSGVKNCYFPLLIPESLLTKEKDHVEGFAPEVAWVDYGGNTKLGERLAVRPTSETIMYDSYSKWVRSWRDLPLRMNQWNNVVRWEFKHATPFLRGREFLWQEGHTVFATKQEAVDEVMEIIKYYQEVYEELLAIPADIGYKSVGEKFAGADFSTTVEPFSVVDGKVVQGGTSHHLGQRFAKAFDIQYLDKDQKKQYPFQNSWGLSTRTIGALILIHGDDKGFVCPPRVAVEKAVIVPLLFKGKEEPVLKVAKKLEKELKDLGVFIDERTEYSAGFKFNEWELKGIPLRIEIGPRDIENNVATIVRRDSGEKKEVKLSEVKKEVPKILEQMHHDMYAMAKKERDEATVQVKEFKEFKKAIEEKKRCLVAWAESEESEDKIKEETGAKSSCIPFALEKKSLKGEKCFYSGKEATCWAYFSKAH